MTGKIRDLSATPLSKLSDEEIIYCHLTVRVREWTSDFIVTSCLDDVETEMRQSRGIQLTSNYVPLLAGFALLDQIGSCYEDAAMAPHPTKGSAIERALYYFGGLPAASPEIIHLYALRNGLVHDASLTSHDKPKSNWYIFRFDRTMADIIRLPVSAWDGTAASLGPKTTTIINPRAVTELVSTALERVRNLYFDRRSDLKLLKPATEILHKYLFWERR
jgi:hypothetical protein